MDSEQRHELEQSDLAVALAAFWKWWGTHGKSAMVVVVVLGGSSMAWTFHHKNKVQARENAWYDLAHGGTVDGFADVAEQYKNPTVQAQALLAGADLALRQSLTSAKSEDETRSRQEDLEKAARLYDRVMENTTFHELFRLNARLGRAATAEARGNWELARTNYEQIIASELATAAIEQQAKARLNLLGDLGKPLHFGAEPESQDPPDAVLPDGALPLPDSQKPTTSTESGPDQSGGTDAADPEAAAPADSDNPDSPTDPDG